LTVVEDSAKATNKKLTQGMSEHNKAMSSAKTDAAKADVVCECYSALTYIFIMQNFWILTKIYNIRVLS
jgi:hypothetical protein